MACSAVASTAWCASGAGRLIGGLFTGQPMSSRLCVEPCYRRGRGNLSGVTEAREGHAGGCNAPVILGRIRSPSGPRILHATVSFVSAGSGRLSAGSIGHGHRRLGCLLDDGPVFFSSRDAWFSELCEPSGEGRGSVACPDSHGYPSTVSSCQRPKATLRSSHLLVAARMTSRSGTPRTVQL